MTLDEYKHKVSTQAKDPKVHEPPVLGSHSDSLGFKTEEIEKPVEKKEVKIKIIGIILKFILLQGQHQEKVDIDEKSFPKLG